MHFGIFDNQNRVFIDKKFPAFDTHLPTSFRVSL